MDFYSMTDKGVLAEISGRVKALRLRRNLTQKQLSEATALSLNSIKSLETGRGKMATLVAVLRELGALDGLDNFLPEVPVSPLQLAKKGGKKRQRASGVRGKKSMPETDKW